MLFHNFCEGDVRELLQLHILHFLLLNWVVVLSHYFCVDRFLCMALMSMHGIRHDFGRVNRYVTGPNTSFILKGPSHLGASFLN